MEQWDTADTYGYDPSLGAAIAFTAIFLMLAVVLLVCNLRFPPNRFMHVLIFAALGEVAGFAVRIVTLYYCTMLTYIITVLFLLLMPNFIALVNYIACGRLMGFSNLNVGCLRPGWVAKIFFISDFLSFGIQGVGGAMLTSDTKATQDLGKTIIIIGLCLQSLALFLFLFVTITIHKKPQYRLRGVPDAELMFKGLYITTALLFVRSIFRLVEYAAGEDSYLLSHEWPMYVFDSVAMAAAFVVYALPSLHYGRCLNAIGEYLSAVLPVAASDVSVTVVNSSKTAAKGAVVPLAPVSR